MTDFLGLERFKEATDFMGLEKFKEAKKGCLISWDWKSSKKRRKDDRFHGIKFFKEAKKGQLFFGIGKVPRNEEGS